MTWRYEKILGSKIIQEKLANLSKVLSYIKSSCIIVCAKMFEYSYQILFTRRIDTFWPKVIGKFCSKGIEAFWAQKTIQEKSTKFTNVFELYQIFICLEMFQYLQIIYCLQSLNDFLTLLSTFCATLPQLCQLFTTSQFYTNFYQ